MMVGNRSELVQWLQNSEVDIAIMGRAPEELPTRAEPFAANPLGDALHLTRPAACTREDV